MGGLIAAKKDLRDFQLPLGYLFGYTPQHQKWVIETMSIKDQYPNSTCTQVSATVQKEVEEKLVLSEESLTCAAKAARILSGNGFCSLREIQKIVQKAGIAEKNLLDNSQNNWDSYSDPSLLTQPIKDNAFNHRSSSYFACGSRDQKLKALDDGYVLHAGMTWYSGFNMGGGFNSPWLITKPVGYVVGGHAVAIIGYDLNYQGQ
jgi:hypothetical protein